MSSPTQSARWTLALGLTVAVLMDALNGTVFSVARLHIMGDLHATPDEASWVNLSYLIAKLALLPAAAWMVDRHGERRMLAIAIAVVAGASIVCASSRGLPLLTAARFVQGAGGALMLVSAQTPLLRLFSPSRQGEVQGIYGLGAVMAPVALAPAMHGWLTEHQSWEWAFWLSPTIAVVSSVCIAPFLHLLSNQRRTHRSFDWCGLALSGFAIAALTYVLIQGERWDWLETSHIRLVALLGTGSLSAYGILVLSRRRQSELFSWKVFESTQFTFGFIVSFIAGFALFGSAFLVPALAIDSLHLPPDEAGSMLAPASLTIGAGLLLGGAAITRYGIHPLRFVPFGIVMVMTAMWLLSGLNSHSGTEDLTTALLLRGLGFGFLFIALTLLTLQDLDSTRLASGVALFNFGRQLGGVISVAFLQTYMSHQSAIERGHLATNLDPANREFVEHHGKLVEVIVARGYDPELAETAASTIIKSELLQQVSALSFNAAFLSLAGLFVVAVPVVLAFRFVQARLQRSRDSRHKLLPRESSAPQNVRIASSLSVHVL